MTDLSALTADQLAEKVLLGVTGTYDRVTPSGREALNELVRGYSERDQAVRERDKLRRRLDECGRRRHICPETHEQRADRLAAALERIDTPATIPDWYDAAEWWKHVASKRREIARDALAASEETPE